MYDASRRMSKQTFFLFQSDVGSCVISLWWEKWLKFKWLIPNRGECLPTNSVERFHKVPMRECVSRICSFFARNYHWRNNTIWKSSMFSILFDIFWVRSCAHISIKCQMVGYRFQSFIMLRSPRAIMWDIWHYTQKTYQLSLRTLPNTFYLTPLDLVR